MKLNAPTLLNINCNEIAFKVHKHRVIHFFFVIIKPLIMLLPKFTIDFPNFTFTNSYFSSF
jgi:hypothetical protein